MESSAQGGAYLRQPEAGRVLRVSERTLEAWRRCGAGPRYRKHGTLVLYAVEDLRAWSDAHARTSTSDAV